MDPKSIVALIAIIISIISLYISANVAWESHFKPAVLKCNFPHLVIYTLSRYKNDEPTSEIASRHIAPSLYIGNYGARSAIINDLRILFTVSENEKFAAYPVNKIPYEAIESPSMYSDYNLLGLGGPFLGFSLSPNEGWKSSYSFSMRKELYEKLKDDVVVEVQIAESSKKDWKSIHTEKFSFGKSPVHLKGLAVGSNTAAGSLTNHVYSSTWIERRKAAGL